MQVFHLSYPLQKSLPPVEKHAMAIGDFDGVHLGHQSVISKAKQVAAAHGIATSIMTFHPHPREVLGISKYSKILAPLEDKLNHFQELEVDYVFVVHFDLLFAQLSPEQFIDQYVIHLKAASVIIGFDFTFGQKGMGTVDTLRSIGDQKEFSVHVVPPFQLDGEKVSSTYIREQLLLGRVDEANAFLGRNYSFRGTVVHGEARGRTIGFPTANVNLSAPYVLPKKGVYAVWVQLPQASEKWAGVMNIGVKPTFDRKQMLPSIEVHIMDWDQDLYNQMLRIELSEYIREEQRFSSIEQLAAQIKQDVNKARQILDKKR